MDILSGCRLCGRGCGADRLAGQAGVCGAGAQPEIAAYLLHFGEEPPISGTRGSGAIFLSRCPLTCLFCQNHQISQEGRGEAGTANDLADMMLELEDQGAHNVNLVSPTPWVPQIAEALGLARGRGLAVPIVYNTGGHDSLEALAIMAGLVDVYLPDMKYAETETALKLSGVPDYPAVNRQAVREMYRQTGPLKMDVQGVAVKGTLIRHLVLPGNLAGTDRVLAWLAREFGPEVFVSLMAQYRPCSRVLENPADYPELARCLTEAEYDRAMDAAVDLGMENVFIQELSASDTYLPDFETKEVFSKTD